MFKVKTKREHIEELIDSVIHELVESGMFYTQQNHFEKRVRNTLEEYYSDTDFIEVSVDTADNFKLTVKYLEPWVTDKCLAEVIIVDVHSRMKEIEEDMK